MRPPKDRGPRNRKVADGEPDNNENPAVTASDDIQDERSRWPVQSDMRGLGMMYLADSSFHLCIQIVWDANMRKDVIASKASHDAATAFGTGSGWSCPGTVAVDGGQIGYLGSECYDDASPGWSALRRFTPSCLAL